MTQPIWNTQSGSIGTFPALVPVSVQLSADPVSPAATLTYAIISGSVSPGLSIDNDGLITGTPSIVTNATTTRFVVRVTDNLGNIKDRTFSITISGAAKPEITTPAGELLSIQDSTWVELPIEFDNPPPGTEVRFRLVQGQLPPGLEINENGIIRGYAEPPVAQFNLSLVTTNAFVTNSNIIECASTNGFQEGRPVNFSGTVFGGVEENQTYFIKEVISGIEFTISTTNGGPEYDLSDETGDMTVTLPTVSVGQPTIQIYSFSIILESDLGNDLQAYSIEVINQNAPQSIGGPGKNKNTREPTIYNTRPPTYDIESDVLDYSYYILPESSNGLTFPPSTKAPIGAIVSDNYFSFKILGHDFDGNELEYIFSDLPLGLEGDQSTGWVTGTPIIADNSVSDFSFDVEVIKKNKPNRTSDIFNFSFRVENNISGDIIWVSPENLGELFNGTPSLSKIEAESDVELEYRIVDGALPPNLTLLPNGEISGVTAFQPADFLLEPNQVATFSFTVEAYSPNISAVTAEKEFALSIRNVYTQPTETLYIKCNPNLQDRELLDTLLNDSSLIPDDYLYRPEDPNFGKASSVIYEHAFGIFASDFEEYVEAITKNHYWKKITLGDIKTAVARDDNNNIIYEVVYSEVIDNLVNPKGKSVSKDVFWPRFIDLNKGPWYTSVTDIYTSYGDIDGVPTYYTSLTPGFVRSLYPNSLENMRTQLSEQLGQQFDFRLLPKWMTSQQRDGSTLGFTPAWVIAYTKPGFSETIRSNIINNWKDFLGDPKKLNQINFTIDRFIVDKNATYNYDKSVSPPAWLGLPSADPTPVPNDANDLYVLFPRKTILPSDIQYNK